MTQPEPVRTASIDDIDYLDDQSVTYQGKVFTGQVVDYYADGQLRSVETFRSGIPNGPEREFYPDGTVKSEQSNTSGRAHGIGRTWFPNGQLESETLYDDASVIHTKRWSENGTELD